MLRSDVIKQTMTMPFETNLELINIDVVCEIEKELQDSPYDVTSLVFLLYEVPDTALQRLIVYQRVSKEIHATNLSLLHEWMQQAKSNPTWKHEILEALLICQLYEFVKKLGFNISELKKIYQPDNIFTKRYINPVKKLLYKLCENMNGENLTIIKKTLLTYEINTIEYESCELIFLKLMSEKIIPLSFINWNKNNSKHGLNFEKFVKIIQKLPGLEYFANELKTYLIRCDSELSPVYAMTAPLPSSVSDEQSMEQYGAEQFLEVFKQIGELPIDENLTHVKTDSQNLHIDSYAIKDQKRVGLCLIINQEEFYLSDQSIEDASLKEALRKREGSSLDAAELEKTMSSFNFAVIIGKDLDHRQMITFIKNNIRKHVQDSDSIFMLCIMSHGVRGHVFASDCIKVKFEHIQDSIFDSDYADLLRGMPKVIIIQACRVDEEPQMELVADSPSRTLEAITKKADFLIYWATVVGYEAFRAEKSGSIFIQYICKTIKKLGKTESLYDIFTKVNNVVTKICSATQHAQAPIFESSLRKKLYLHIPL